MASRTRCYSLKDYSWSDEILRIFSIDDLIEFPSVVESGDIIGYTNQSSLPILNEEHIGVAIAGHDNMVGAPGINLDEATLLNSTGTTEGLLLLSKDLGINNDTYSGSLTNGIFTKQAYYTLFSSMPTGGEAFEWYQKLFHLFDEEFKNDCDFFYESYIKYKIVMSDMLLMIPHLSGSGAPFKNSS